MLQYAPRRRLRRLKHVSGRDPKRSDPTDGQPTVPFRIPLEMIAEGMLFTIDLDGELQVLAVEIKNVRSNRMLTAKLKPVEPAALELQP